MRGALLDSPIHASVAALLQCLPADHFPDCTELNRLIDHGADHGTDDGTDDGTDKSAAVVSGGNVPIQFVDADTTQVPGAPGYEGLIFRSGWVPTRACHWHDLFNALAWLAFPRSKRIINARHIAEIDRLGGRERGRLRDLLSLFDEGGVIVACADRSLAQMLLAHQWKQLFCEHRAAVNAHMRCWVFGHAIMEKGVLPYHGVTGKALIVPVEPAFLEKTNAAQVAALDVVVAARLAQGSVDSLEGDLSPLPILGIPGWCADNVDPRYYDDTQQFRPPPSARRPR